MLNIHNRCFFCLIIAFALIFQRCYSNKIDSLERLINEASDDYYKIELLYTLGTSHLNNYNNTADAIKVATDQLNLSKLNGFNNGTISAYTLIAYSYLLNKNYSKALENYFLAVKYLKETSNSKALAHCYSEISRIYNIIDNPKQAIYYNQKVFACLKSQSNIDALSRYYLNFANSYKALKEHNKEISYLNKGIALRKKHLQFDKLGNEYNKLGFAYWNLKKYDDAIKYYNYDLQISLKYNDTLGIVRAYNNIGSATLSKNEVEKAIEYFQKAIPLNKKNLAHTYLELVNSYCKLNQLEKASEYLELSKQYNPQLNELVKAYIAIAQANKIAKNKDATIYYLELSNKLKDSISTLSSSNMEITAKTKYDAEGVEARIYQAENELLLTETLKLRKELNYFLVLVVALLFLISVGAISIYKRKLSFIKQKSLVIEDLLYGRASKVSS